MVGRRGFLGQAAAVAALAVGGCSTMAVEGGGGGGDARALHARLLALETGSWQHIKDRDLAGMRTFLADDAILIFGDGSRFTKAGYLAVIPDLTLASFSIEPGSQVVQASPDVAVLVYKVTYTSAMKAEKPVTMTVLSTSTFALRGGNWISVLYQETLVR